MALKDNWTDLVDNESYIQVEDINKIASAVIESEGDIEALGEALANISDGETITTKVLVATDYIGTNELYVGENDDIVLDENGIYLSSGNNPNQEICVGESDEVVISQQGIHLSEGAKLFIEGNDVIGDIEDRVSALEGAYELLENITTTEELTEYIYNPSANEKKPLKAIAIWLEIPAATKSGMVNISVRHKTYYTISIVSAQLISTTKRYHRINANLEHGSWKSTRVASENSGYENQLYSVCNSPQTNSGGAEQILIRANTSGAPFPVDTVIKIYGVEE